MSKSHSDTGKMKGILTDVTKCIGCERCVEACTYKNKMPFDVPAKFKIGDGLSGDRLTSIVRAKDTKKVRTVRKQCLHCLEPSCAGACLVGAFTKRPDGPVQYDSKKCIGCRYCMLACPFTIPRYEWEQQLPFIRKCKMDETCRVEGGMPACVSACPTGATIFGVREELIKEAKKRIAKGGYINHIWGEHEFGGTSVMYISDVDLSTTLGFPKDKKLEALALPSLKESSIPHLNHLWVMWTPIQFGLVFTSCWGIWFLRRRSRLMAGEIDRGSHGAPDPHTAGIDEVCQIEPAHTEEDKEGE